MSLPRDLQYTFKISKVNLEEREILVLREVNIKEIKLDDEIRSLMSKGLNHMSPVCKFKCYIENDVFRSFNHGDAIIEILGHIDQSYNLNPRIVRGERGISPASRIYAADTAVAYYEISGLFSPFASFHNVGIYGIEVLNDILNPFQRIGISVNKRDRSDDLRMGQGYKLSMILKTSLQGESNIFERYLDTDQVISIFFTTYNLLSDHPGEVKIIKRWDDNLRARSVDHDMSD